MWIITENSYFTEQSEAVLEEYKILAGICLFFCCFFSLQYQKDAAIARKF